MNEKTVASSWGSLFFVFPLQVYYVAVLLFLGKL